MESEVRTVVDGEASESDDDELSETEATKDAPGVDPLNINAVSISGEASESEEEIEEDEESIPALKVETRKSGLKAGNISAASPKLYSSQPKYDSLLHKKLREKNANLRRHMVDSVHQMYLVSAKDLHNTSLQLHKSQTFIMDISHNMKLLTNDLFYLEDKVDIVTSCQILPDINIIAQPNSK
ncbi:biogenesis of lysosome-related organelles complex 1 subunit 3-like isoform X3 [Ostrea edulis]|uniref:biogenesis of lysosome-related organelles complex 1 subunit 3-like isoform X3 n=1 Tax=Ostrea edulis TaxID=37623 RepID=UPI002095A434|nr:biogenesis of lysosome-related organelles complex 1 subunit 3-like isoform X3 [Ostrea edulis]